MRPPLRLVFLPRRLTATEADGIYIVKRGESLADIAAKVGLTEGQLLELNGIRNRDFIFEGQQLAIKPGVQLAVQQQVASTGAPSGGKAAAAPNPPPPILASAAAGSNGAAPVGSGGACCCRRGGEQGGLSPPRPPRSRRVRADNPQPVSAAQAEEVSPALGAAADDAQQNADPTDYSVAKDDTIVVATAETLGHYADWLQCVARAPEAGEQVRVWQAGDRRPQGPPGFPPGDA